jgi:predicted 3-demethylubiquinone-9 3-methyltransferase (glyoxalase superfamily)
MTVTFQLAGQKFTALNGGPHYKLTPAFSMFVSCESQKEIDDLWRKLGAGGEELQCGWINDKYGLCWQVIPSALPRLLGSKDAGQAQRTMKAMMGMKKLDIAGLEAAAAG